LSELTDISDKVNLKVIDFEEEKETVKKYNIKFPPATVLQSDSDLGLRYYGIPGGYEFSTIINSIGMIGKNGVELSEETHRKLSLVKKKVEILVFVTPPCPHCPKAAVSAYKFAFANENIETSIIEANEFPDISREFSVMAVPKIVINKGFSFEGAYPDEIFADNLIKGIG